MEEQIMYMHAFQNTTVGMAMVSLDGRVIKCNKAVSTILGYTEEELTNISFSNYTHKEDIQRSYKVINESLEGLRDSYQIEKRFIHKNGEIVWGLLNVTLIRDAEGDPLYFLSQLNDISDKKETEEKLREMGKQFQLITDNSLDKISKHALNGDYTYVSPACVNLLGYTQDELIGVSPLDLCHPDDIAVLEKHLTIVLNQGEFHKLTFRMKLKSGEYRWFESAGKGIIGENGQVTEILTFTRDITHRKSVEERLRLNEKRYKSLFENNPDMCFIVDLQGNYTSINKSFEKITGYTYKEIVQDGINFRFLIEKEDLKKVEKHFAGAVAGNVQRYEASGINKQGRAIILDVVNAPIMINNEVVGVYGIAKDISKQKAAEAALKQAKTQLESFIDNNVDPILIFNKNGKLLKVNEAFETTYGWSREEIIGQDHLHLELIPEKYTEKVKINLDTLKSGAKFKGIKSKRKTRDGDILDVDISGFPTEDEKGELNGWAITLRDVTEAKLAEEVLRNSEKLSVAGQLAAGIAHEIRNPMTAIKGFIQLMNRDKEFSSRLKYFDIILKEISRIELIISELLILAKPQDVRVTQADITSLIEEVAVLLQTQAILNNVTIETEFENNAQLIFCEKNQIKQVCINFIKNAIEAMPKGGLLRIKVSNVNDKGINIQFIDQGFGIPSNLLKKLGEPFYTTKEKGTGLGFMVSKKIIENHGGSLTVQSEENKGTTVEVFLPLQRSSEVDTNTHNLMEN